MKNKDFKNLKAGEYILHKRYGVSFIEDYIVDFGPVIYPCTYNGKVLLYFDAKTAEIFKDYHLGAPFLENNHKQIEPYSFASNES